MTCRVQTFTQASLNSLKSISVLGELRMGAAELQKHSHFRKASFKPGMCVADMYLRPSEFCTVDTGECVAEIMSFIYNHHLQRHTSVFTVLFILLENQKNKCANI